MKDAKKYDRNKVRLPFCFSCSLNLFLPAKKILVEVLLNFILLIGFICSMYKGDQLRAISCFLGILFLSIIIFRDNRDHEKKSLPVKIWKESNTVICYEFYSGYLYEKLAKQKTGKTL
ncbi:MAG: hypothetical protein V1872_01455 [bacterium]